MIRFLFIAILSLVSNLARAETLDLQNHGRFSIDVPANWKFSSQAIGDKGYAAGLRPTSGANAGVKISIMFVPQPKPIDEAKLTNTLLKVCDQYVGTSIEQTKVLKEFGSKRGFGKYCVFTDASLVGKPKAKGEFKMIAPGLIQMTDDVIVIITIVAEDVQSKEFTDILAAIKSVDVAKSQ